MKSYRQKKLEGLIGFLIVKAFKLGCLIIVVAVISTYMYEVYNDEIKWEVWHAFETQYELDMEEFQRQNGIISKDEGIVNFWDEQAEPVFI